MFPIVEFSEKRQLLLQIQEGLFLILERGFLKYFALKSKKNFR